MHKYSIITASIITLTACAGLFGGRTVVPDGPGQTLVTAYGVVDKQCVAIETLALTKGASKASLDDGLAAAKLARTSLDIRLKPLPAGATREVQKSTAGDIVLGFAQLVKASASDAVIQGVIGQMQADGNRQTLTELEWASIDGVLSTDCGDAQDAVSKL